MGDLSSRTLAVVEEKGGSFHLVDSRSPQLGSLLWRDKEDLQVHANQRGHQTLVESRLREPTSSPRGSRASKFPGSLRAGRPVDVIILSSGQFSRWVL